MPTDAEQNTREWYINMGGMDGDDYAVIGERGRRRPVCHLEPRDYTQANARLIAAAPDLLDVAKRLIGIIKAHDLESLSCDRDGHKFCECLGDAVFATTAAIAKAEQQCP